MSALRAVFLLAILLMPGSASAQTLIRVSYGVFAGGQLIDLTSTSHALDRGAVESNPLLSGTFPQLVIKKSLLSAGVLWGAWYLQHKGRPKLANAIRLFGGGVGVFAAVHNVRVIS